MTTTNGKAHPNLIDGKWTPLNGDALENHSPADHNDVVGLFPMATVDDTRARGLDEAIEKANAISFGLSAGVVTNNLKQAFAFANQVEAGVVKINEATTGLALNAPFGGFKQSSANTFKEMGQAAIDFYTRTKTIYVNHG
jgi:acyl-CoA reductase-like NAD-dependent aldehyde dehydrogenase